MVHSMVPAVGEWSEILCLAGSGQLENTPYSHTTSNNYSFPSPFLSPLLLPPFLSLSFPPSLSFLLSLSPSLSLSIPPDISESLATPRLDPFEKEHPLHLHRGASFSSMASSVSSMASSSKDSMVSLALTFTSNDVIMMSYLQKEPEKRPLAAGSDSKQSPPEASVAGATSLDTPHLTPLTSLGGPDSSPSSGHSSRTSPLAGMVSLLQ